MKIVLSESQYQRLIESKEEKVFNLPSLDFFDYDPFEAWKIIQKIIDKKGNPPYSINGDLYLRGIPIESLGNLQSVDGYLYLEDTPIKSLGNLQSVGGTLDLRRTPIESLGNLQSVGGYLDLEGTPLSKMYNEKQIRKILNVEGDIYL